MHVVVASQNPTKIAGVSEAFGRVFDNTPTTETLEILPNPPLQKEGATGGPLFRKEGSGEILITGVTVESGVGEQPVGDDATKQGALSRAQMARELEPRVDYWVGVEGGVVWYGEELECMAWVTIIGANGRIGQARSNGFLLPPAMAALIAGGMPQNLADNQVFGRENSGTTNGTVGYLSRDLITRTHYTADTVILALAPFLHPEHYPIQARELPAFGGVKESLHTSSIR